MTEEFRQTLNVLIQAEPDALAQVIEDAEDAAYSRDWSDLDHSEEYVGLPAPVGILRGAIETPQDLTAALGRVEPRWMLDAIMAVSDYVDGD